MPDSPGADPTRETLLDGRSPTLCHHGSIAAPAPVVAGDRYEVLSELGRGGMGVVYRALDRDVALKVLRLAGTADSDSIERFRREAHAAAALDHPNIVRVHDVGALPDGSPFYAMEMLEGEDLAQAVERDHLPARVAVEAIRQVALALLHAHQKGILHRDVKPQNIFLRRSGAASVVAASPDSATVEISSRPPAVAEVHALLLDFGLAKLTEGELGTEGRMLTRSGQLLGTPVYMAPEQARGSRELDARVDVYGLGATLYHAIARHPPFEGQTLAELLEAVQRRDPLPLSQGDTKVDPDLATLCAKCMQKEPSDRYATAGELAEDCRRSLAGESIVARPVGPLRRAWNRARRNRAVATLAALLAVVLLGGIVALVGSGVVRRVRLARAEAEARGHLDAGRFQEAKAAAEGAVLLAPGERRYQDLLDRAHAGEETVKGGVALARYRDRRAGALELASRVREMDAGIAAAPPKERARLRSERWEVEERLREAEGDRESSWSDAVLGFTSALTWWKEEPAARAGLAELYWDRYLRAEAERDPMAENAYGPLAAEFGGAECRERILCVREVEVAFHLPARFDRPVVTAYLYGYRRLRTPPILTPQPVDPRTGRAIAEANLSAPWQAVPLSVAEGAPQVEAVARARRGSIHALEQREENRVAMDVVQEMSSGGQSADLRLHLPKGSYLLLILSGQGLHETRYPFVVARDELWVGEECDLAADDAAPGAPPGLLVPEDAGSTPYWVYIAAGTYRASGDPRAEQLVPRDGAIVRVPEKGEAGFFLSRFEVTLGMYLMYLNDRAWHTAEEAVHRAPRRDIAASASSAICRPDGRGVFSIAYHGWLEDYPATGVNQLDALDYCRWATKQCGSRWEITLPSEDEWEKAARGADGRYYPWGDEFDVSFCRMLDSRAGEQAPPLPEPYGLFPVDESPYGVRDLAGGMREWTGTTLSGTPVRAILHGGAWSTAAIHCGSASRAAPDAENMSPTSGFRLCAHAQR